MKKAFTLAELLIAITITALITEAAYFASSAGQRTFNSTSGKVALVQNARVVLDRLGRELRQATEIITTLPPSDDDPNNPPPSEIAFEDGHVSINQYITYKLDGNQIKRIVTAYYFGPSLPDSSEWVVSDARDADNNLPNSAELENDVIAQDVSLLQFYGLNVINISLRVNKNNQSLDFNTAVYPRNL